MMKKMLPNYLQQRLSTELKAGELIMWSGQPDPNRYMRSGFGMWVFFIPWTLFSMFWIAAASGFKLPSFDSPVHLFPLFGLPFLLIGLAGLSTPLWLHRKADSIVYAVTDTRVIMIEGRNSFTVKSYFANDITQLERTEYGNGIGDLNLSKSHRRDNEGSSINIFAISDVRRVEQLIRKIV
jgi:hypothetical protein